ncbi:TPA: hypothetical protein N2D16_002687 [Clostridium botulinum]|nr:hypothetical protein [Clostridium botulinum]HCL4455068.1 hypothetical protein [Clostridium botulinum]
MLCEFYKQHIMKSNQKNTDKEFYDKELINHYFESINNTKTIEEYIFKTKDNIKKSI